MTMTQSARPNPRMHTSLAPEAPHRAPSAEESARNGRVDFAALPPLHRDRAFWGMTITQFLGAFNDSVYKQLVLLLCLSIVVTGGSEPADKQFWAQSIFAISFVLFSGISGWWCDRVRKRSVIISAKVLEVLVMTAGMLTFMFMAEPRAVTKTTIIGDDQVQNVVYVLSGVPWPLIVVLFMMGAHSAYFGPAKYGILPEMVRESDLPKFNGMIQLTTFVALVVGVWLGGWLMDSLHHSLWVAGMVCMSIAVVGTLTSLLVRKTPVAQPGAPFRWSAFAIAPETWKLLKGDKSLRMALWVYSIFWFVAALLPMIINWLGVYQFHLNYADTSLLLASTSIGIAVGFVLAGWLSAKKVSFGLVRAGAWGLIICFVLMALPSTLSPPEANGDQAAAAENAVTADGFVEHVSGSAWPHLMGYRGSQILLVVMGFCAGLFALPVQVFLQSKPPNELKGRMIGTMNLINWVAIIFSAVFYELGVWLLSATNLPKFGMFALAALVMLPIALFYRPADVVLRGDAA
jgi:acyl-[acyl-carrier-protein]-phospholipid O-acyltransferase/long-chain-fatty-acid--[acyl-carrier-protein] ligase